MPTSLPLELLHTIFLQVAESSPSSRRTLCAVSSWVRHIALPLLHKTVFIDSIECLGGFDQLVTRPLACPPSPSFRLADNVRRLWVSPISETLASIVLHCNVTHLAIHPSDLATFFDAPSPNHFERQDPARAGKGDLHVVLLQDHPASPIDGTNPLFGRITHLQLNEPIRPGGWQSISVMPNLTHLAVPCENVVERGLDWIFNIVAGTSVEVFVLSLPDWSFGREWRALERWVRKSRRENEWIYLVCQREIPEVDWCNEIYGGATVWERAAEETQLLMNQDPVEEDAEAERWSRIKPRRVRLRW
ncbi:hypothetical protein BD779DRAFT_183992 [Infundibulicybe gibba]|nr:hypothetical protein BD779DRAFT_183992 [Infundibulicybe gibba]